jgi:hypothetical protein
VSQEDALPHYCVNIRPQSNGDHEVHLRACVRLPYVWDRMALGWHSHCRGAVRQARLTYPTAIGCAHCSPACRTT